MKTKDKYILIALFLIICLNCKSQEIQNCKSQEIQRIDIKCVDFRIETPFAITCEKFEDFFKEDIDTISIEDKERIIVFSKIIKELKEADQSKYLSPDTRVKIEIIYKDKKAIMCMSHLIISVSEKLYFKSDAMLGFIEEAIKSKPEIKPKR